MALRVEICSGAYKVEWVSPQAKHQMAVMFQDSSLKCYQGHGRDFSGSTHNFSNLPPPSPANSNLTRRSSYIAVNMLSFVYCKDRPGWNNLHHPVCYLHASLSISFKIQTKLTFWTGRKESVVLKTDFRLWKKQIACCFRKNIPNNQTELNGIEASYIAIVVVLIFTLSFFSYILL